MSASEMELLSQKYSVPRSLVGDLFQQHHSVEAVVAVLQSGQYLYDRRDFTPMQGQSTASPGLEVHRPQPQASSHGEYVEPVHHVPPAYPRSTAMYPVAGPGQALSRSTSAYPPTGRYHFNLTGDIVRRQQSSPAIAGAGARYPLAANLPSSVAAVGTPPVGVEQWLEAQLAGTKPDPPHSSEGPVLSCSGRSPSLSNSQGETNVDLPFGSDDDDPYTQALTKHQQARLERIQEELAHARQQLNLLRKEISSKQHTHTMIAQRLENDSFPSPVKVSRLVAENNELRQQVGDMNNEVRRLVEERRSLSPDQRWACSYCTFLNHPSMTTKCECCEMPRHNNPTI